MKGPVYIHRPDEEPGSRRKRFAGFSRNALILSVAIHVLFGAGAAVFVVEVFDKKHITFHASEPPSQAMEVEHKVQMAKKNNVDSAPPDLKRIVTTSVSSIALPELPEVPQNDEAAPSDMSGINGALGTSMDGGSGNGGSGGGGGGSGSGNDDSALMGTPAGKGLEGYLYDLKQTIHQVPTEMTPTLYHQVLQKFVAASWDLSVLSGYYRTRDSLHLKHIMIPMMKADVGPQAFEVEKEVKPTMWVAWYKGKVIPPLSATYRFVGICDDILVVRINGKNVLDGSLSSVIPERREITTWPNTWIRTPALHPGRFGQPDTWTGYNSNMAQMRIGPEVTTTAGLPMDMEILVGEEPGGWFHASLFVENVAKTYPTDKDGEPILPPFELGPGPSIYEGVNPPVNDAREPWQVWEPERSRDDLGLDQNK